MIKNGINSGASAAKLLGAGGGGFILFYVNSKKRKIFLQNMGKKNFLDFNFEDNGTKSRQL